MDALLEGLDGPGIFGMAGTIGMTAAFGRLEGLSLGVDCWGGAAEDGVVGWVERASDGGCDVDGVSKVGRSRSSCPSAGRASLAGGMVSATVSTSAAEPRRDGSSTGTLDD